jgi:hypothetical protein
VAVERWFLGRVQSVPTHAFSYREKGLFGMKTRSGQGWRFDQGATAPTVTYKDETGRPGVGLLVDGRRVCDTEISTKYGYNIIAIHAMAALVKVKPLPQLRLNGYGPE